MYAELTPASNLRALVECYWTSQSTPNDEGSNYRVLPDGCADLIFDLTPGNEHSYWVGTMTKSLVVEGSRSTHLFGIRFNPGGARALLGIPIQEITDEQLAIGEVTPSMAAVLDGLLNKQMPPEIQVNSWFKTVSAESKNFRLIQKISEIVKNTPGEIRVSEISDSLGLSRQYLNRVMRDNVGIDLKTFQRVLRMRALVDGLKHEPVELVDWSSLALEHGFYDQSHFVNDFRELVGLSPTEYFV